MGGFTGRRGGLGDHGRFDIVQAVEQVSGAARAVVRGQHYAGIHQLADVLGRLPDALDIGAAHHQGLIDDVLLLVVIAGVGIGAGVGYIQALEFNRRLVNGLQFQERHDGFPAASGFVLCFVQRATGGNKAYGPERQVCLHFPFGHALDRYVAIGRAKPHQALAQQGSSNNGAQADNQGRDNFHGLLLAVRKTS